MKLVSFGLNNQTAIPKQTRQEQRSGLQALNIDTVSFNGKAVFLYSKKAEIEQEIAPLKLDKDFRKHFITILTGDTPPLQAYISRHMNNQLDDDHKKALSVLLKHSKGTGDEQPTRMAVEDICEECKIDIADLEK